MVNFEKTIKLINYLWTKNNFIHKVTTVSFSVFAVLIWNKYYPKFKNVMLPFVNNAINQIGSVTFGHKRFFHNDEGNTKQTHHPTLTLGGVSGTSTTIGGLNSTWGLEARAGSSSTPLSAGASLSTSLPVVIVASLFSFLANCKQGTSVHYSDYTIAPLYCSSCVVSNQESTTPFYFRTRIRVRCQGRSKFNDLYLSFRDNYK